MSTGTDICGPSILGQLCGNAPPPAQRTQIRVRFGIVQGKLTPTYAPGIFEEGFGILVNCCMMDCVVAMPLFVAIAGGAVMAGPRGRYIPCGTGCKPSGSLKLTGFPPHIGIGTNAPSQVSSKSIHRSRHRRQGSNTKLLRFYLQCLGYSTENS